LAQAQPSTLREIDVWQFLLRIPQRVRERRFWTTQFLILAATVHHYTIEVLGYTNPFEVTHGFSITLYAIPLIYAALNYGWEGAILNAAWAAVLTSPSTWIWQRAQLHWLTELG